jgi:hypothetical protein
LALGGEEDDRTATIGLLRPAGGRDGSGVRKSPAVIRSTGENGHQGALSRLIFGTSRGIAGTVYGTVLVMATITAGAADVSHASRLPIVVGVTTFVFWLAHVYADALGETVEAGRRLDRAELASIAGRERTMLIAAVLPVGVLVLGAVGILEMSSAVWLAMGLGVATLAGQGVRYARFERLSGGGTAAAVAANVLLGLLIVALKVAVSH